MSAHDVRTLHPCIVCGDIGTVSSDLPDIATVLVLKVDKRGRPVATAHPRCLNQDSLSVSNIVRLPVAQLERVRMSDVSALQMRLILEAVAREKRKAERMGYEHTHRPA